MEVLHRLGCGVMQGFLFSRPLPPDDLETLAAADRAAAQGAVDRSGRCDRRRRAARACAGAPERCGMQWPIASNGSARCRRRAAGAWPPACQPAPPRARRPSGSAGTARQGRRCGRLGRRRSSSRRRENYARAWALGGRHGARRRAPAAAEQSRRRAMGRADRAPGARPRARRPALDQRRARRTACSACSTAAAAMRSACSSAWASCWQRWDERQRRRRRCRDRLAGRPGRCRLGGRPRRAARAAPAPHRRRRRLARAVRRPACEGTRAARPLPAAATAARQRAGRRSWPRWRSASTAKAPAPRWWPRSRRSCASARGALLAHRHQLVDELAALCARADRQPDRAGRGRQLGARPGRGDACAPGRRRGQPALSVRGVRARSELLAHTRRQQQRLRGERESARDALKALIQQHAGRARRARRPHRPLPRATCGAMPTHRAGRLAGEPGRRGARDGAAEPRRAGRGDGRQRAAAGRARPRPTQLSSSACASSRASCAACPTRSRPTR